VIFFSVIIYYFLF